jgi:hypothetical protein
MTGTSNRIAGTIAKAVLKTLATLAVTAALSLLLWRLDPRAGMLVLVVGPVLSMIQSYKHEWPLHWATILLPAFAAVASFIVQLATFPVGQAVSFLAPAILFGLLLGSLQGRGHRIHLRGTRVMVKRTWLTLVVWTVCFLTTQAAALFNLREIVGISMAGGAFSTAMVLGLSLVLFSRYRKGRRQVVRLKKAAQLAVLLIAFLLPLWLAAPLRLRAQDAQSVAERLLLDSDLPQRFTINKQIGQRLRADTAQELQQLSGQLRQANLTPPKDIGRLATLFDNDPMANMAILSLVLYEFPSSEDAAAFHNLMLKESPGSFGSWETVSGCGDVAVQTMDEWTGFALSARGRWVIQMIMQYPFTMFITEYDNSYSPDIKRAALEQARAQVMGSLTGMLRTADSRLHGTAASRRDRPDDGSVNRTGGSGSRSLPPEGTAAATAGVILLLSGGAVSIASGAASAAASALQAALANAAQSSGEAGTRILSGDQALLWLKDNGFVKNGQPTDKFTGWQRQLASNETPDTDGLGAMVGNWSWGEKWGPEGQRIDLGHKDEKGNWVEPEITIVVGGGEPPPPSEPEAPPPEEGPGPEPEPVLPPEKKEPPPEKEPPPPPPEEEPPPSPDEACKDNLRTIHQLEAGIEKIKQINQQMQNEINELRRQKFTMAESWGTCAVVDGASWVVSEFLILNPLIGLPVSTLQAAVVNALKNTIRDYFLGDKARPGHYQDAIKRGLFFKGLSELFKSYIATEMVEFTRPQPSGAPLMTKDYADKFVAKAGQLVRATANPFFMGVDYGTLIKNLRVVNELISHKDDLIRSNAKVIDQMDLDLKAANEKYLDCAGRAMEAIRKFVERKKETEAWVAQQNLARRQRLRGAFGG